MNILLFVTTLIMVMGILTYAKIQTFISFSAIQTEFNNYMKNVERSAINEQAIWVYENTTASAASKNNPVAASTSDSLSRLSFGVFVDEKKRQTRQNELNQNTWLTKRLIDILYHDQQFYTDAIKKNPYVVDSLLERIYQAATSLPKDKKITKAPDLANLDLGDPELNLFLYKILNGTQSKLELTKTEEPPQTTPALIEDRGEDDDQEREDPTEEEYKTPTGYRSLLDFITLKDGSKIRIYLAPKELLLALFGDPATVDAIIKKRNELYKAITTGGASAMTPKDASNDFDSLFKSLALPEFDKAKLDFNVTKTNPRNYE